MSADESTFQPHPQTDEQRDVRRRRRDFKATPLGNFARQMMATMREYLKFRRAGVSREDAVKGIEAVLRESWPLPPSKFQPNCQECEDTGWRPRQCSDRERCGRRFCVNHPEYEHSYVEACFCPAGEKCRRKVVALDDAVVAAGRTRKPKPKGLTHVGA